MIELSDFLSISGYDFVPGRGYKMVRFLVTAFFVIFFLIISIPLLVVEWIIGKYNMALKDRISQKIVQWAFLCCTALAGVRVDFLGTENIPAEGSFLYVSNHRSYFDIVLTYIKFPRPTGYVAKVEMEKIPLLSTWMRNIHCLFLDRDNIKEGMKTILKGIQQIQSGVSVCIFPEGTRCADPEDLLPFREGSMRMAQKAHCPIIPICICNSSAVWEDHFPAIRKAHVIIEFGQPIMPDSLPQGHKFLGAHVRQIIKDMYDKNRALL